MGSNDKGLGFVHVNLIVSVLCNSFLVTNCNLKKLRSLFSSPPLPTHSFCAKKELPNALEVV